MRLWLLLFLCTLYMPVFAQQKTISGVVADKNSEGRIARVNILNTNTQKSVYNNLKGEFKIDATIGDVLIFTQKEHYPDTLKITSYSALAVYMSPLAIQLKQVTVRDTVLTPEKRLAMIKSAYSKIYGRTQDGLIVTPGMGAGIGIDALYNAFSRSGRNAEHLRQVIDWDYRQTVIDYRFNKSFVASVTKLKDPQLTDFMQKYRPSYEQVTGDDEYQFIAGIRRNHRRYMRNKSAFELTPLITPPPLDPTK